MANNHHFTLKANKTLIWVFLLSLFASACFFAYARLYTEIDKPWLIFSFIPSISVILFQDRPRFWLTPQGVCYKTFLVKPKCIEYSRIYKIKKSTEGLPKAWLVEQKPPYLLEVFYDSFSSAMVLVKDIDSFETQLKNQLQKHSLLEKIHWIEPLKD